MQKHIEELTALEAKATPGPWEAFHVQFDYYVALRPNGGHADSKEDVTLIVAMRNALPELLNLLEMERLAYVQEVARAKKAEKECFIAKQEYNRMRERAEKVTEERDMYHRNAVDLEVKVAKLIERADKAEAECDELRVGYGVATGNAVFK